MKERIINIGPRLKQRTEKKGNAYKTDGNG